MEHLERASLNVLLNIKPLDIKVNLNVKQTLLLQNCRKFAVL